MPVSAPIAGRRAMRQGKAAPVGRPRACAAMGQGMTCAHGAKRDRRDGVSLGLRAPGAGGGRNSRRHLERSEVALRGRPIRPWGWRAHGTSQCDRGTSAHGLADALMTQAQCALNAVQSHVHPELHARPKTLGASAWSADQVFDKFDAFRLRMANRYSTFFLILFSVKPF